MLQVHDMYYCDRLIGMAYALLQIPFAVHYLRTGKRLVDHDGLVLFECYGDKVSTFSLHPSILE